MVSFVRKARNQLIRANDINEVQVGVETLDASLTAEKAKIARVDPGTSLAADEVVTGDGAGNPVKRNYRQIGVPWVNPRSDGLSLDGVNDERTAFLSFLAAQPAGAVVAFDDRADLRIDSQVQITTPIDLVGHGASKIHSAAVVNAPLLRLNGVPDARIASIAMEGAETAFVNTNTTNHYAIEAINSDRLVLEDIFMSGFSRGANVENCDHARIDLLRYEGLVTGFETWVQYHNTLRVVASDYVMISRLMGRNCGSALLVGGASRFGRAWGIDAINCWDNGVYLSEAHDWDVDKLVAEMTASLGSTTNTGAKARGNGNKIHDGIVKGYRTGAVISPYGTTLDADGYAGGGSEVSDMRFLATVGPGVIVDLYSGAPGRDMVVARNLLDGVGTAATTNVYGILVQGGTTLGAGSPGYVDVIDNEIINLAAGGPGIRFISGDATHRFLMARIARNRLRNLGVGASQFAIRPTYLDAGSIEANVMEAITGVTYAVYLENSVDTLVTQNRKRGTAGTTGTIRIETTNTGTLLYHNRNCTVSDGGSGTVTTP